MGFEYNLDTQLSSILDAAGEERLRYEYDEFGRPVNASGSNYNVSQTYADVSGLLIGYQRVGESAEDNVNSSLTWQGDLLADFITSGAVEGSVLIATMTISTVRVRRSTGTMTLCLAMLPITLMGC